MMQPEKLLYMAIDGVAPRAKARHMHTRNATFTRKPPYLPQCRVHR